MTAKDRIKIAARLLIRECLKVLWVLPVKKRRILFESYDGTQYSCNPKYLSEYLKKHHPGKYELVWCFDDPSKFKGTEGIRAVKKRSFRWFLDYLTSGVRVTNAATQMTFFPKRKGQLVINTWHAGGAYKRTGIISEHVQANSDFKKWRRREQAGQFDLFLSSSPVFSKTNVREAYLYKGRILKSGMPRNDIFFDEERVGRASQKVREHFGIRGPVILYAPTYRGNFNDTGELPLLPYEIVCRAFKERFGEEAVILVRAHYTEKRRMLDAYAASRSASGEEGRGRLLDATDYPDMQELLCAADLLITDYSSSIWDYALLGRPAILYVPDLDRYEAEDRGFYTPIREWPGIICRDGGKLEEAILGLDEDKERRRAGAHLEAFRSYERGRACEMTERVIRHFLRTGSLS